MIPVVADGIIVRLRDMRFTFDIVVMAIQEKDNASSFEVSSGEITDACVNATVLVLAATLFAVVRTKCAWADLARWNPTMIPLSVGPSFTYDMLKPTGSTKNQLNLSKSRKTQETSPVTEEIELDPVKDSSATNVTKTTEEKSDSTSKYVTVDISEASGSSEIETASPSDGEDDMTHCLSIKKQDSKKSDRRQVVKKILIALVGLVLLPMVVIA
ncbi:Sulfatase-like protein, partial [Phytophthora palmivora]